MGKAGAARRGFREWLGLRRAAGCGGGMARLSFQSGGMLTFGLRFIS
jgi:hypothetical protein